MISKDSLVKGVLTHLGAIILFLAITLIYFNPEMDGKVLPQGDVTQYVGMSQELREYYDEGRGEGSAWTNSLFSGMPSYQISVWGGSPNFLHYVDAPFRALGNNAGPVFAGMVMAYILFLFMGLNPILSILGAVAYSLSSYNIIIIAAGHITKAWALAYLPLIISGMVLLFRRKYMLSGLLMALGLAMQINSNHLQITYYTGILCAFLFVGFGIKMIKEKKIAEFAKASALLFVAVFFAVLCNLGSIYGNYEMGQESIRGKSELTATESGEQQSTGLDKDYAFAWSYGKSETFSLLVPDIHGGASGGKLGKSSYLYKEMVKQGHGAQVANSDGIQSYTYWGDQPGTSGPVYFGAIICFLFVLGMVIIPNKVKWVVFAATLFFILLSWGRNFDGFNTFMFHNLPMYNKFRTVSMALVIPALTMLVIAVWGLQEFFSGGYDKQRLKKAIYIATGVTGGLALFFWIAPGFFFNFTSPADINWKEQMPQWYYDALLLDREDLLSSDGFRSLAFILATAAVLWFTMGKRKDERVAQYATLAIAVLVLIDLWGVDKRYLNADNFVPKEEYQSASFKKSIADEIILKDTSPSQRVLKLGDPFNDASVSYYHKSIGGYHAAKLRRYQELISNYMQREVAFVQSVSREQLQASGTKLTIMQQEGADVNTQMLINMVQDSVAPLLSGARMLAMLNAKYIIHHPELAPIVNPYALGNAWFVDKYTVVANADEEMATLATLDVQHEAIVDARFAEILSGLTIQQDTTATIEMTECKPNRVRYKSRTATEQLAVLSEVYYAHGWQAYVDGSPVDHVRVNWTLRGMRVPAGEHEIEFKFEPKKYNACRMVSSASGALLILLLLGSIVVFFRKKENKEVA